MNDLTNSIRTYINNVLIHRLTGLVSKISQQECENISLKFIDTPKMDANITPTSDGHIINISSGWLLRLGLALTVIERMWATTDDRPPVLAINTNPVYDDYFYDLECDAEFNFSQVPDLAALFVDTFSVNELKKRVDSFEKDFHLRKGGGQGLLNFTLPLEISDQTAEKLNHCSEFLVLHEVAHVLFVHSEFLEDTTFSLLDEIPKNRLFIDPYRKKAVEVDADSFAFLYMVREKLANTQIIDLRSIFLDVLSPVLFVISVLDIGRRTIHQYQGKFASHPLPDIRAISLCNIACEQLSDLGIDPSRILLDCRDEVVKYCINSYQRLGIPVGAFYIMGNRLATLDDEFISELANICILNDELSKIQNEYWKLEAKRKSKSAVWNYEPFGLTENEIREAAKNEAIAIFNNEKVLKNEKDMEEKLSVKLKDAKKRLGEETGYLIITHHTPEKLDSPFLKKDWWKEQDKDNYFSNETQKQYEQIMNNAMMLLFQYAEVKVNNN